MENTNQIHGDMKVDENHLLPSPHYAKARLGLILGAIAVVLSFGVFYVTTYFGIVLLSLSIVSILGLVFSILGLRHAKKWMGVTGIVVNSIAIIFALGVFVLGLMQGAYLMGIQEGSGISIPQVELSE